MKWTWICLISFILSSAILYAQEGPSSEFEILRREIELLKEKDNEKSRRIEQLERKIEDLQAREKSGQSEGEEGSSFSEGKEKTISPFIIEEDFGEEEELESEFYREQAGRLGSAILEEESEKLTSGALLLSGFFSLQFHDFATEDSTIRPLFPPFSSFANSHINLYVDAKVLEDFRFFTELRFIYQPFFEFLELAQSFRSGDVIIERAWGEWLYRDWLNIRAGNFLVPYGIWNLEHGDPILLSTFTPLVIRREIFPQRATGIQIYGLVDLGDELELSYYTWVGNGKGSQIATQDEQNNKAVGGRLALKLPSWGNLSEIALGVSGYMGKVLGPDLRNPKTQQTINQIFVNEGNTPVLLQFLGRGLTPGGEPLNEYRDQSIAVDFTFRFYSFFFQSEFIFNSVEPTKPASIDLDFNGVPDIVTKASAFHESGGYMQYAYEFDLNQWGFWGLLTPFFRTGFVDANDDTKKELTSFYIFSGGINWKPNANLTLKAEYSSIGFPNAHQRDFDFFISSATLSF